MGYKVRVARSAEKSIAKLDLSSAAKIVEFLESLDGIKDPRSQGKALTGNLKGYWRYRVGDYRIVCEIHDDEVIVLVVKVGHRREIYR